ncbi:neurotactin-like [Amphibalanus amphitrite]|uniref:neurotactin-like n=1 Tax=Amphibalanus amphitrite TaxID=1232801 RepID=UPI001C90D5AB|nr:neurotactin-like [Amphibalanus amphitrite]
MADSEQHPQDQQVQQTERADPIGAESPAPAAQPEHTTQVPGLSSAPGRPVASSPLRRLTDRLTTMFSPPRKKVVERRHTVETTSESQRMVSLGVPDPTLSRLAADADPEGGADDQSTRTCAPSKTKIIIVLLALVTFLVIVIVAVTHQGTTGRRRHASYLWDATARIVSDEHVETMASCGLVRGRVEKEAFVFHGVPYALAPVGRRRFQTAESPPGLSSCWTGVLEATGPPGAACPHLAADGTPAGGAEDCLTVDIYTPRVPFTEPLPVVVFVGGDTLSGRTPAELRPEPELARRHGVVFVTVRVRRSVLGFLASEVLSRASHPHASGNYGLSDLLAALEWLSLNAEHFGGSAQRVTLLGHQSGATLMSLLTAVPRSKQLYTNMWLTGGSGHLDNFTMPDLRQASENNAQYLSYVDCADARCLRNRTVQQLLEAVPRVWHRIPTGLPRLNEPRHNWLVRDGFLLTESVHDAWAESQERRRELPDPLIVLGVNAQQDGAPDLYGVREWNVSSVAESYVATTLGTFPGELRDRATRLYLRHGGDPWTQIATMVSDVRTVCPLYAAARRAAGHFTNRAYFYLAAQKRHGETGFIADARSDIEAILGVYRAETIEQRKFVDNMQHMFYKFVREGRLPLDASAADKVYVVDDGIGTVSSHRSCDDLWNSSGLYPQYARRD